MHKLLVVTILITFFISCSSSDENMEEENEMMEETEVKMGDFVTGAHVTTGKATVSVDGNTLIFTNFKTDTGPRLLVYLTTGVGADDFVSLGDLKGVDGDYTYTIPANTNLANYKIVDIWCVDFSVSFGHAELK